MGFINKHIEWIVAITLVLITSFKVTKGIIHLYSATVANGITLLQIVFLFFLMLYQNEHYKLKITNKKFIIFFLIYSAYVLADMTIFRVYPLERMLGVPKTLLNFFAKTMMILAYIICAETIYTKFKIKEFLILSFILCVIPSIIYINKLGIEAMQMYSMIDSEDMVNRLTISFSNMPILILTLVNKDILTNNKTQNNIIAAFITILVSYILIISTKRGPILWTIVSLAFCFYLKNRRSLFKYALIFSIISIIVYLNLNSILDSLSSFAPHTVERIKQTIYEGNTAARIDLDNMNEGGYSLGLKQFFQSPIVGDYFRITANYSIFKGCYCHNIFIEILMTMGLLGFIPFIVFLLKILSRIIQITNKEWNYRVGYFLILFLASFLQLQTTGTIVVNIAFWLFFYMMCSPILNTKLIEPIHS